MRARHRVLASALLLALAGCGVTDTAPGPAGSPAAGLPGRTSGTPAAVHVYFYSAQGLERVSRLHRGPDALDAALRYLVQGPNAAERARGLVSYVPGRAPVPVGAADGGGTVRLRAPRGWESRSALRQLVCTAADAVAPADGTGLGNVRVTVDRAAAGGTVTQVCMP
jgi:hypothetical protein